jgi:hypothetical protein
MKARRVSEDLDEEGEDDEDAGVSVSGAGKVFLQIGRRVASAHDA